MTYKTAILYICNGRYRIFWDAFYHSSERYFLPDQEKHYFIFTDGVVTIHDAGRTHLVPQKDPGWPGNALKRYRMFAQTVELLSSFDYIFFFNANAVFVSEVGDEILPSAEEGLVVTRHPGFYRRAPRDLPYERNPLSRAYIAPGEGTYYLASGINGGRTLPYFAMINELYAAEEDDASKGITAVWHDESHLNRYIMDRPHKLLHPGYCYPQGETLPFEKKILILDKYNYGGHNYLRGLSDVPVFEKSRPASALSKAFNRIRALFVHDMS